MRNSLTRIVLQSHCLAHSEPLLRQLHWLPVQSRICFKLVTMIGLYKALSIPSLRITFLHSSNITSLLVRYAHLTSTISSPLHPVGLPLRLSLSFRSHAPAIRNLISLETRSSQTIHNFKQNLKTHYFLVSSCLVLLLPCIRLIYDVLHFNIKLHF